MKYSIKVLNKNNHKNCFYFCKSVNFLFSKFYHLFKCNAVNFNFVLINLSQGTKYEVVSYLFLTYI